MTFGWLLDDFWVTFGWLFGDCWVTFGALLDDCWTTLRWLLGALFDDFWALLGSWGSLFGSILVPWPPLVLSLPPQGEKDGKSYVPGRIIHPFWTQKWSQNGAKVVNKWSRNRHRFWHRFFNDFYRFWYHFGLHFEVILGSFLEIFRSEGALGAKNVIFTKTLRFLSFFDDFEVPRGPKSSHFWSQRRLFRSAKIESDFSSIFEAKSAKSSSFWLHFGSLWASFGDFFRWLFRPRKKCEKSLKNGF